MELITNFIVGIINVLMLIFAVIGIIIIRTLLNIPRKKSWCFNRLNVKFSLEPFKEILDFFYTRKK
ncbi:hypothetical protein [Cetobacterium somerae]